MAPFVKLPRSLLQSGAAGAQLSPRDLPDALTACRDVL